MGNIYLVGFMGTGKTSTGKELARRLKRKFIDLDDLIVAKQKMSIPGIFSKLGEPHFRNLEKQALEKIAKKDELVVACGGGIVIDPHNIKIMKETGVLVCLTAKVSDILKRTNPYKHRPLLNVKDRKEKVESLLKKRAPFYVLADKIIPTSGISVKETADRIIKLLSKEK